MFLLQIVPGSLDLCEDIGLILLEGMKSSATDYSAVLIARHLDDWGLCVYNLTHAHLLYSVF